MFKKMRSAIKPFLELVSKTISDAVNFVLLGIVYFIGIGIVSMSMKLFGSHFLELKKTSKKSNWRDHRLEKEPLEKYYRTF